MLPHVIHYCWFGGNPLPADVLRCIESWKKFCPDYEIKRWDETNYDINKCEFMRQAYHAKKWAFVSDYARIDIVYQYGGVYLDTDVELIKPLDPLLETGNGYWGFENNEHVASGLGFAAPEGTTILKEMLDYYNTEDFNLKDMKALACPNMNTDIFIKHGLICNNKLQIIDGISIYPTEYFCPINHGTGRTEITSNTVSIHHYSATWTPIQQKLQTKIIIFVKKCLPLETVNSIRNFIRTIFKNVK